MDNNPTGKIQIFNNPQFGEIRVSINEQGEPMFCLVDLCNALGIKNSRDVKTRIDEDDVALVDAIDSLGRTQQTTFVNESGLYTVVLRSEAGAAKSFQKWVTKEVLPSIRKHGIYATPPTIAAIIADPDFGIQLLTRLKEEQSRRIIAEQQIEADKPKVTFAKAVESSRSSCLVGELAKILKQNGVEIGQNRLFEWLRKNHYLCTQTGQRNNPTQKAMENGLFEVKKRCVDLPNGQTRTVTTTVVTGKGQIYFVNKFLNNQNTEEK